MSKRIDPWGADPLPDGREPDDAEADEATAWNESQHVDRLVDGGREES